MNICSYNFLQDAEMLHKILDGQTMKKAFPLVKKIVLMEETEKDNLWGTHSKVQLRVTQVITPSPYKNHD